MAGSRHVAMAGPASGFSASRLVKTTEMTAMPMELATCWLMLSSVEPRATWCDLRVLNADVMSGIIVAPIPRPMMNRTGMR